MGEPEPVVIADQDIDLLWMDSSGQIHVQWGRATTEEEARDGR